MASWLVCLPLDLVVWVRALAWDIFLCSWARHFPLTVPLFTQVCNCTSEFNAGSNPAIDWHPIQGAVEIL